MRLGVALTGASLDGGPPNAASMADACRVFERLGADSIWLQRWLATGRDDKTGESLTPWSAVAGGPALFLAGWRGRWVERAAETAGWIASAAYAGDDQLAAALGRFRNAGGQRAIVTNVQVRADDVGATVDRLRLLADAGFDDAVVVDPVPSTDRLRAILDQARS